MQAEPDPTPPPAAPAAPGTGDDVLDITVRPHGDAPEIVLAGEFDLGGLAAFTDAFLALLQEGPAQVGIDAGAVRFIDSSGVKALIQAHHHARTAGSELRIVAVSDAVRRVLTLAGVQDDLLATD